DARRAVARHLAGCPALDDLVLIVAELASNAVLHSASRGAFFTVRAELHADYVRVEAVDLGGPWRSRQHEDRPPRPVVGEALPRPPRRRRRGRAGQRPQDHGIVEPGASRRPSAPTPIGSKPLPGCTTSATF